MVTEDDINSILERGELKVRPTMHTTKHIVMIVISDSWDEEEDGESRWITIT